MDKLRLTQQLLALLPEANRCTLADALKYWWQDLRYDGYETTHLRLTAAGHEIFQQLDIQHWHFDLDRAVTAGHLLALSHHMTAPYYLNLGRTRHATLWIYGSQEAMMFSLMGDLDRFIRNIARQ